jgi:pimeloyl-ACP methyl ester carboxylesterase
MTTVHEFEIAIPDGDLDDLRSRLDRARWPAEVPGVGWARGVPVAYLRELAGYWRTGYDWRRWEVTLNRFPQYTTEIDGQRIHFIHARSPVPAALPLIVTHGWPGSVAEFINVIGPLTDPVRHGARSSDAFHVVAPSLPGFGFSTPLSAPGWNHRRIALAWAELMARLGYDHYGAQGGDTGSLVSPELGRVAPDNVVGVHINGVLAYPAVEPADLEHLTDDERVRLDAAERLRRVGTGYADLQSTRPQTIAYALHDSPIGQLAWIVEKFWEWTDPARALPDDAVDRDHLLTDVTIYWLTGTGASSAHLYYEVRAAAERDAPLTRSGTPTGIARFPTDPTIRRVAEREHNVVHWSDFERGGHFAALEAPDLLVDDIRTFFGRFREEPPDRRPRA